MNEYLQQTIYSQVPPYYGAPQGLEQQYQEQQYQAQYYQQAQSIEISVISPQQRDIVKSLDELEGKIELSNPIKGERGSNYMTLKEYTKLIGDRTDNLSKGIGVGPTVLVGNEIDPLRIAQMEMAQRRFSLSLHRTYPDGVIESWNPNNMKFPDGI